jgi:phosphonate transport system substrate-binding protein
MKPNRRFVTFLVSVLLLTGLLQVVPAQATDSDGTLVFGFLPILSTQRLITRFKPLVDQLSAELGRPIRMETAPDYSEFIKRTRAKRYDIVFTAPHLYYLANEESGYKVIVRVNASDLKAIIVATKASHITKISELKGKKIAMPDRMSLVVAMVRNYLRKEGLDPDEDVTIINTPSHNAALLTAYNGVTDVAGLMLPPYKHASETIRDAMVTLATTPGLPHMPIAVSPTLAPEVVKKITHILTTLDESSAGNALLKKLGWPHGFVATDNKEYAPLKKIVTELHLE